MNLKNIVIIGAGFAGLSALKVLSRSRINLKSYKIIIIDKKDKSQFLPMLPDIISGKVSKKCLEVDIQEVVNRNNADFIKQQVKEIDFEAQKIILEKEKIGYEYLIISSGSETNFFGNSQLLDNCYKLDNTKDGERIKDLFLHKINNKEKIKALIVGGGYTGIEIATNIKRLLTKNNAEGEITILEKAQDILLMLPDTIRSTAKKKLIANHINIINGDSLKEYDGKTALLESGKKIENVISIWTAGVKPPEFIVNSPFNKERQRVLVTDNLQPKNSPKKNIFIIGDNAAFLDKNLKPIRMAVMFSIEQGKVAGKNIINAIKGKKLIKYKPLDLGYLIPFAFGQAPGIVMNIRVGGKLGYFLHYFMCIYRSSFRNKLCLLKQFCSGR